MTTLRALGVYHWCRCGAGHDDNQTCLFGETVLLI
jgi:hypothetical protein